MNCPSCKSADVDQTGEFDLTVIDRTEARHDFECRGCGCMFQIIYSPTDTVVVGNKNDEDWRR